MTYSWEPLFPHSRRPTPSLSSFNLTRKSTSEESKGRVPFETPYLTDRRQTGPNSFPKTPGVGLGGFSQYRWPVGPGTELSRLRVVKERFVERSGFRWKYPFRRLYSSTKESHFPWIGHFLWGPLNSQCKSGRRRYLFSVSKVVLGLGWLFPLETPFCILTYGGGNKIGKKGGGSFKRKIILYNTNSC